MSDYEQPTHEPQDEGNPNPGGGPVPPPYGYGYPPPRQGKSAVVAALLSICPGAGHIYVGAYRRGFAHILVFSLLITLLADDHVRGLEPLFGMFLAFFIVYTFIDAARRAQAHNRMMMSGGVAEEPVVMDERFGPGVGVGLIVVGGLLLLKTRFDFDFYWLRDWWPLGLVLVGANILRSNRRRGRNDD